MLTPPPYYLVPPCTRSTTTPASCANGDSLEFKETSTIDRHLWASSTAPKPFLSRIVDLSGDGTLSTISSLFKIAFARQ